MIDAAVINNVNGIVKLSLNIAIKNLKRPESPGSVTCFVESARADIIANRIAFPEMTLLDVKLLVFDTSPLPRFHPDTGEHIYSSTKMKGFPREKPIYTKFVYEYSVPEDLAECCMSGVKSDIAVGSSFIFTNNATDYARSSVAGRLFVYTSPEMKDIEVHSVKEGGDCQLDELYAKVMSLNDDVIDDPSGCFKTEVDKVAGRALLDLLEMHIRSVMLHFTDFPKIPTMTRGLALHVDRKGKVTASINFTLPLVSSTSFFMTVNDQKFETLAYEMSDPHVDIFARRLENSWFTICDKYCLTFNGDPKAAVDPLNDTSIRTDRGMTLQGTNTHVKYHYQYAIDRQMTKAISKYI